MDSSAEQSESRPREVAVGEWARPFESYDDMKPFPGKDINQHLSKIVGFESPGVGNWSACLVWDGGEFEEMQHHPENFQREVLVLMPNGAKVVRESGLKELEDQLEARLLRIFVEIKNSNEEDSKSSGYNAVIKLKSGEELVSDDIWMTTAAWKFGSAEFSEIRVPDTGSVAESIEVKTEKVQDQKN